MGDVLSGLREAGAFREKPERVQQLIAQAVVLLAQLGVPLEEKTARQLVQMALAFAAVADVETPEGWRDAKDLTQARSVKTRDIIEYVNEHFGESVSSGSYDDVRRKHLILLVRAGVVVPTKPGAARNDPTRGYALNPELGAVVRSVGSAGWEERVREFMRGRETLAKRLSAERVLRRIPVAISSERTLEFGPGEHNELIRVVVEEFLPRFGYGARVLYVGDAEKKLLYVDEDGLRGLGFFDLAHGEQPDVVAYSQTKNWLYLIEAVHTSGAVSPVRRLDLERLLRECPAERVYVTAFLDRRCFRRFASDIAWETEVWIAEAPDHLIHFDGERFLGPYPNSQGGAG